jgi:putative nucleotidyltransferase with HDIG domain
LFRTAPTPLASFVRRVSLAEISTEIYTGGLVLIACAMAAAFVVAGYSIGSWIAVAAISGAALVAERGSIRVTKTLQASIASLPFMFAGVLFGPLAAIVVGAVGLLPDLAQRDDPQAGLRWATWTASRAISAGASGFVAWTIAESGDRRSFGLTLAAVLAGCLVDAVFDFILVSLTIFVRKRERVSDVASAFGPLLLASVPLYAPIIAVVAYAYRAFSPWSSVLFVIPAFAAQRLFLLYQQQRETADELTVANERLERANVSFATALVATLDARDRYTAGHSAAVAIYARDIAARMGLSEADQQKAHLCGLVHDIGKVGLAPGLLEKPGGLTLDERRQMEQHSVIGERILEKVDDYAEIAAVVRYHHERVDGNGYPDGLEGDEIPLLSRIIAVADAYNAMTSDRPYREAMPSRVARLRLAQAVESQFDTAVVAAFEAILASATESYRAGSREDFSFADQEESALPLRLEKSSAA